MKRQNLLAIGGALAGSISIAISVQIRRWDPDENRGISLSHAGFTLADGSLLSPPFAWIDRKTWDSLSHNAFSFLVGAPVFLIEIVSSGRSLPQLKAKIELWIANGVHMAWLVNPDTRSVTVYRKGSETEIVRGAGELRGYGKMAGLVFSLREVWD